MATSSPAPGGRPPWPADSLSDQTRAYGTQMLYRLGLAVTISAGASLLIGLWAMDSLGLWRLGGLGLLAAAGVVGLNVRRNESADAGRRPFVVLLLVGFLMVTRAACRRRSPGICPRWSACG